MATASVLEKLEPMLNERDVARITGMSVQTIRRWRLFRGGPRYLKIGSAVRYKPEDIAEWLESRPAGGEMPDSPRPNDRRSHKTRADEGGASGN
jgi:predicted DNA-binding transcriptional regulator AlpA